MLQLFFAGEIRGLRIRPPEPAMFPEVLGISAVTYPT